MADNKPKLPFRTKLLASAYALISSFCFRSDGTVNRRLQNLIHRKVPAPATTLVGQASVSFTDVPVEPSRNIWFRLFVPSVDQFNSPLPLVVYFHGGGFDSLGPDLKEYHDFCCRIAASVPAAVASVKYRLAPEHRYPAAYDDCFDALKFIDSENCSVLPSNVDLEDCFLAGDSAGGNIAHHVAARSCGSSFRRLRISGLLSIQPFFGGEERTESEIRLGRGVLLTLDRADKAWRNFLPEGASRDHEAAHVFGGKLPEKFPRTLLIIGGFDLLQDWQRRYGEWVRRCGVEVRAVEYPNAIHGFYAFGELPESAMLLEEINNFMGTSN